MAFVPPVFSKFGKACSDLLTKKWEATKDDFKHKFSVKSKSQNVTIQSTVTAEDDAAKKVAGKVNVTWADKSFGEVSEEVNTAGACKTTVKLTNLRRGATVTAESNCKKDSFTGKTTVEYVAEPAAVTAEYNSKDSTVAVSAAVGFEGFSAGAQATVDTKKMSGDGDKKDAVGVEGAIQYEDGNLVATLKVEKSFKLSASLYHAVSSALQLGTKVSIDSTKPDEHSVAVGGQYKVNADTLVKGKVDVKGNKDYVVLSSLEHKLSNPNVVVGITQEWSSVSSAVSKFGFSLAFGEN